MRQELLLENTLAKTFAKCAPHLTSFARRSPQTLAMAIVLLTLSLSLYLSCFLPFDRGGAVSCAHDLLARRAVPQAATKRSSTNTTLINAMNLTFFFCSLSVYFFF